MASPGMDQQRLAELQNVIRADIKAGLYHGAVIKVARAGAVALEAAIGAADAAQTQPLALNSVFSIFSVTKAFTNMLVLRAIELGRFALTTSVSELIPEFTGHGREKVQIWHLLSHQAGFPIIFEVKPGMYIDRFEEMIAAVIEVVRPVEPPCTTVAYSPLVNHVLMAEGVRRTDPKRRGYRQIVQDEILSRSRCSDTSVGLRADLKPRHVVPDFRGNYPIGHRGHSNSRPQWRIRGRARPRCPGWASSPRCPTCSALPRCSGRAARSMARASCRRRRSRWRGATGPATSPTSCMWREVASAAGIRRRRTSAWDSRCAARRCAATCSARWPRPALSATTAPGTTLFWVDPERDLTFTFLSAGVMESNANTERFQKTLGHGLSAVQ